MFEIVCGLKNLNVEKRELLTRGSNGIGVHFRFGSEWDGLAKIAVFKYGNTTKDYIIEDDTAVINWEWVDTIGDTLILGVYGSNENGSIVIPTIYTTLGTVIEGAQPEGDTSYTDIENISAQVIAIAEGAKSAAVEVYQAYLDGDLNGKDGEDGYTPVKGVDYFDGKDGRNGVDGYTPVKGVDYFDGKNGKDGVDGKDGYTPVKNVDYFDGKNGKDGADGKTPVKGVDYWNEADKAEINAHIDTTVDAQVTEAAGELKKDLTSELETINETIGADPADETHGSVLVALLAEEAKLWAEISPMLINLPSEEYGELIASRLKEGNMWLEKILLNMG